VPGAETGDGVSPNSGTGAGLIAFLAYLIKRNEMVEATASALRTGCRKVLTVESDLNAVDIKSGDLDDLVRRFRHKYRGDIKDRSLDTYEQRFRQSADMYRKWLNEEDWRPNSARRRQAPNGATSKSSPSQTNSAGQVADTTNRPSDHSDPGHDRPPHPGMITYPFPIRAGLQGKITLPEDLTRREAKRIAAFVAALVSDEEDDGTLPNGNSRTPAAPGTNGI
jgi:hypothetical protein